VIVRQRKNQSILFVLANSLVVFGDMSSHVHVPILR